MVVVSQWRWVVSRVTRKVWFRAAVISVLSILLSLSAVPLAPLIPYEIGVKIGGSAAGNILGILASSMLVATTFSLGAMVTAFGSAAQQVTPRATQLLIEDKTAQHALSTFLGAFLFGIVGVIAISANLYGREGRAVLVLGTLALILYIVVTLLGWIQRLTTFGRVEDIIDTLEDVSGDAIDDYAGPISFAVEPDRPPVDVEHGIRANKIGYVTYVDRKTLSDIVTEKGIQLSGVAITGDRVDRGSVLAGLAGPTDDDTADSIRACFRVENSRDFDTDPRFAHVVLAEIASRAMSPAVNDPGTALSALDSGQRLAVRMVSRNDIADPLPGVGETPLYFEDSLEALIVPIARDGAGNAEVQIRIQHVLGALASEVPEAAAILKGLAVDARERAKAAMTAKRDFERVDRAFTVYFG